MIRRRHYTRSAGWALSSRPGHGGADKVTAHPALFGNGSVLQQHLVVAAFAGALEDLEGLVEFAAAVGVG